MRPLWEKQTVSVSVWSRSSMFAYTISGPCRMYTANFDNPDQTVRMRRLLWVFAVFWCSHSVPYIMSTTKIYSGKLNNCFLTMKFCIDVIIIIIVTIFCQVLCGMYLTFNINRIYLLSNIISFHIAFLGGKKS